MSQDAVLGGNFPGFDHIVGHVEQAGDGGVGVIYGVDADDGVAGAVGEAFVNFGADAFGGVGGVVGLVAGGEGAGFADGVGAVGRDGDFFGGVHQVEVGHQFGDACDHFGGEAVGDTADHVGGGSIGEEPLAKFSHSPAFDFVVHGLVYGIVDDAGDFIFFVRHGGGVVEDGEGDFGEDEFGGDAFGGAFRGHACEPVAGFFLVGFAHEEADVREFVGFAVEFGAEEHVGPFFTTKDSKEHEGEQLF